MGSQKLMRSKSYQKFRSCIALISRSLNKNKFYKFFVYPTFYCDMQGLSYPFQCKDLYCKQLYLATSQQHRKYPHVSYNWQKNIYHLIEYGHTGVNS